MAKKFINKSHIEGSIYQHNLEIKVTGENSKNPGTEYITGTIDVATDNAGINIVTVHFSYVTALTAKGTANETYNTLKNIIFGVYKTVMKDGADVAHKIRIDGSIGLNEFYTDRNGQEELVSAKRVEGSFAHIVNVLDENEKLRDIFDCDIVITKAWRVEANEEKGIPEKAIVKGAIFNFRGQLLPVEFTATTPSSIDYFENLGASDKSPVFTHIKGRLVSESVKRVVTEESAFGDPYVREYTSTRKDFVITWAAREEYMWDDESTLTAQELLTAMSNREITLAELKRRREEYKASRGTARPVAIPANGGFNF